MGLILGLAGASMNDALGAATRAHIPMFRDLGHELREINFSRPDAQVRLQEAMNEGGIEFGFSAMGGAADLRTRTGDGTDRNLWESLEVPFLSLMGDTPAYFFDRHVALSRWHGCLYFFPEHLAFRKRLPLTRGMYGLIPPFPFDAKPSSAIDFKAKSKGRLLFLKNGNDPRRLLDAWRETLAAPAFVMLAEMASDLSSRVNGDDVCNLDAYVCAHLGQKGFEIDEFITLRLYLVAQLDDYLRRVKSTMLGTVLAEFPVDIQGHNWEHVEFSGSRARYLPGGDYTESGSQIERALAIIDMSPNTQGAPHDRPMRASDCILFASPIAKRSSPANSRTLTHSRSTSRLRASASVSRSPCPIPSVRWSWASRRPHTSGATAGPRISGIT